jgi:hypothetical protein
MVLSYPLMAAIQEISARIGRVTGVGIAANLRNNYPKPLLYSVLFVVSVANVFNLGADIGAMGSATQLVLPGNAALFIMIFGVGSLAGVLLVPYSTYAKYLKWLTISLFAYVGVVFFTHVSWPAVLHATLLPHVELSKSYVTAVVAVLGTTISPYLFFWQASQEVEEVRANHGEKPLKRAPAQAQEQLGRIRIDTYLRHGVFERSRFLHYSDRGCDIARSRDHRDFDFRPGRKSTGAPGGTVCLSPLCVRHRRHGAAGRSGASCVGLLRNRRSVPMEDQSRAQAGRSNPVLCGDCGGDPYRPFTEFHAYRPGESAFLGRDS